MVGRRAAAKGDLKTIELLIKHKNSLDINQPGKDSGKTALDFAKTFNQENAFQLLIQHGAKSGTNRLVKDYLSKK